MDGTDEIAFPEQDREEGRFEEPSTRSLMVLLVPLMLVTFVYTLDQTIVATTLPTIGRAFHSLSETSWVASAYLLTCAVSALVLGKLGDLHGRKRVFQVALVVFLVGSALCALAQDMPMLIITRALQGIGGGGIGSLAQAIVGDLVPARRRSKYLAYVGMVGTASFVSGPLLGGVFADDLSWRWIFIINLPIGLVALAIIAMRLHIPAHKSERRIDYGGAGLVTVFTASLLLVTVWGGNRYPWPSGPIIGLIVVTFVSLGGFILTEGRSSEAITPLRLFKSQVFSISFAQFGIAVLVFFAPLLYIPEMREQVYGDSAFVAGLFAIPLLIGSVFATMTSGQLIARSGHYKMYPVIAAPLTGISMYFLSQSDQHSSALLMVLLLLLAGAGSGLFVQVAILAGQASVRPTDLGVATGALNFSKTLGAAIGSAVFGAILTAGLRGRSSLDKASYVHAYHSLFLWAEPFMAVSFLLAIWMREMPLSERLSGPETEPVSVTG